MDKSRLKFVSIIWLIICLFALVSSDTFGQNCGPNNSPGSSAMGGLQAM